MRFFDNNNGEREMGICIGFCRHYAKPRTRRERARFMTYYILSETLNETTEHALTNSEHGGASPLWNVRGWLWGFTYVVSLYGVGPNSNFAMLH